MPIEVNDKGELIAPPNVYGNLRSEAMSDLLSRKPGFLSRWALLIFLFIFIALAGATWFIHYPDVIKAQATLIATNAPKEIVVLQEGRLVKLFVRNNETAIPGTLLAFIESAAKHEQVLQLSAQIDSTLAELTKNNTQDVLSHFAINGFDSLGELQTGYQQFIAAYQQFSDYLKDGFYIKKKRLLGEDFLYLQKNYAIIQQQKELMQKDLSLSEETYKANALLLKDKVISKQDDRNEQSKLLNKQLSIPQINAALLINEIQQREKQKEIIDLEHSISQQKVIFQQAVQTFQSQLSEWMRKYVIKAPIGGKINFQSQVQENQFLTLGKTLLFINPSDTKYYAEVNLKQYNFGKADKGQDVQLRFDAYPYQEFGYVKGYLSYITDFATDSGFLAHIQLPEGLITNHHKTLHYRNGLKAEAQIITKDMRVLERFYYNIINSVKR